MALLNGTYGDEKVKGTTKLYTLGQRMVLDDGRVFRYGSAGEAIGAGMLCMQAIGVATDDMDLSVQATTAVGATAIPLTTAGAVTEDLYADGYIYINDADGEGHIYRIASHAAVTGAGTLTFNLVTGDVVAEALTTSSLAGLMKNPYSGVELWDVDDIDGVPVGVAATELASGEYGWIQTWGYAAVLTGAQVPVLGSSVMPADTAADDGHVEVRDEATVTPNVGIAALIAAVDTDYGVIKLTIDP